MIYSILTVYSEAMIIMIYSYSITLLYSYKILCIKLLISVLLILTVYFDQLENILYFKELIHCCSWYIKTLIYWGVDISRHWNIEAFTYQDIDIHYTVLRRWHIKTLIYLGVNISRDNILRRWYIKTLKHLGVDISRHWNF